MIYISAGNPGRHLPVDPGEVPLLPAANQPRLEKLYKAQLEPQQELHEGNSDSFNIWCNSILICALQCVPTFSENGIIY